MNYLWCGMIFIGIFTGAAAGKLDAVTEAVIHSSREAIQLCITMAGVMAFWTGIMKIAERSGLVQKIAEKLHPLLKFFFPQLPLNSAAEKYISLNIISNILGLGWAATPAGISAMQELEKLEEERRAGKLPARRVVPKGTANWEMCTFLILNISSLQLLPMNIIAFRSQYGSIHPSAIVGPAILVTMVSTLTAVVFCCIQNKGDKKKI